MIFKYIYILIIFTSVISAIWVDHLGNFDLYKFLKPLSTILILAFPIIFWNSQKAKYSTFIIAALIFCLIGDVFLLQEDQFIFGLASFLVGHLLFSFGFVSIQGFNKHLLPLIVLLVLGGSYLLFLKSSLTDLLIPVIIYVLVILFMVWQAIGMSLETKKGLLKMVGVAASFFAFSDALIAYHKFKAPMEYAGIFILSTYWLAIFLMAISTQEKVGSSSITS